MRTSQVFKCIEALARTDYRSALECARCVFNKNSKCARPQQRRRFSGAAFAKVDPSWGPKRRLQTLAIETSCDDTSVAVLSISDSGSGLGLRTQVLFHDKVTAHSQGFGGIHPLVALDSHQTQLGQLVQRAIRCIEPNGKVGQDSRRVPDFVSATRGPGMRSNLSVGLELAKGLSLAWDVPLVGVHHMQAHALTPRLCSTIGLNQGVGQVHGEEYGNEARRPEWSTTDLNPRFPFLSLLVSGGHTMLIDSKSLIDHRVLAESQDIAIGDYLDKAARAILPESELITPFGKALEDFAFPAGHQYDYTAPKSRQDELERRSTMFGWSLGPPLAESKGGEKSSRRMIYSFSGLLSSVQRLARLYASDSDSRAGDSKIPFARLICERRELAIEVQRVAFEHLGSRILLHLETFSKTTAATLPVETVVVSGGVASNNFLRHVLRSMLAARGYSHIKLLFPPPTLCTDNALMIAWAGMEMYDAGYESDRSIKPLRKWSMDPSAEDGGILGVGGWKKGKAHQRWTVGHNSTSS